MSQSQTPPRQERATSDDDQDDFMPPVQRQPVPRRSSKPRQGRAAAPHFGLSGLMQQFTSGLGGQQQPQQVHPVFGGRAMADQAFGMFQASAFQAPTPSFFGQGMGGFPAFGQSGAFQPQAAPGALASALLASFPHDATDQDLLRDLMQLVTALANGLEAVGGDVYGARVQTSFQNTLNELGMSLMHRVALSKDAWDAKLRSHFAKENADCERCGEAGHSAKQCPRYFSAKKDSHGKSVALVQGYDPKCGRCGCKISETKMPSGQPKYNNQWHYPPYGQQLPPQYAPQQQPPQGQYGLPVGQSGVQQYPPLGTDAPRPAS